MGSNEYISTYTVALDAKGRVSIPANFRKTLAATETEGVNLRPLFYKSAIMGCDSRWVEERRKKRDEARSSDPDDPSNEEIDEALADVRSLPIDETGRIRLPDDMIAYAGLKKCALFVGNGLTFQIWDPEKYRSERERLRKEREERFKARGATP